MDDRGADDDRATEDDAADFAVRVSMRGRTAHLAVKGAIDEDGAQTLELLLDRLPQVDVTEVVVDLTGADDPVAAARGVETVAATAAPVLDVTIAETT